MGIANRLYRILRSRLLIEKPGSSQKHPYDDIQFPQDPEPSSQGPKKDPTLAKYYANLEVPYGSDLPTVKAAWKQLMRKYHPDLHAKTPEARETAQAITQSLNHAYRELEKHLKNH